MTLICATLTPGFALLSQDTCTSHLDDRDHYEPGIAADWSSAAESTFGGSAHGVRPVLLASTCKLVLLPALGMLVGGSGSLAMHMAWAQNLVLAMQCGDRFALPGMAPGVLRATRKSVRGQLGGHHAYTAVHVGWDRHAEAPIGFAFSSAENFEPTPLGIGHTCMPVPAVDDPDYAALYELWKPATRGVETERFHVMFAENAHRSCRRGLLRPGVGIGGELHTARVDRDGLAVRLAHRFPADEEAA